MLVLFLMFRYTSRLLSLQGVETLIILAPPAKTTTTNTTTTVPCFLEPAHRKSQNMAEHSELEIQAFIAFPSVSATAFI